MSSKAGLFNTLPSKLKRDPWHGQSHDFSAPLNLKRHPICGHNGFRKYPSPSSVVASHMESSFLHMLFFPLICFILNFYFFSSILSRALRTSLMGVYAPPFLIIIPTTWHFELITGLPLSPSFASLYLLTRFKSFSIFPSIY